MHNTNQLNAGLAPRYEIERQIGEGGMATVYLARDLRHNRPVAVKVLKRELGALLGPERFLAEIAVTASLQHPHLLPLFDSGEVDGLLYYVMPYVEGETLRARLAREHQLPVDDAIRLARGIASALDYAHKRGVIHRDLKPENILLHGDEPLVSDFGIALAVSRAAGERITQSGLTLGTPQYMSPEQASGDHRIDARSDVYSLGAVLYEMLAGEPPHTGPTPQSIIARIVAEDPKPVAALRKAVSPEVDAAVGNAVTHSSLSPAGTSVAFASTTAGTSDIWVQNVDGSNLLQLTNDSAADAWPVWSPDGRSIIFGSLQDGAWVTRRIASTGGAPERVVDGFFRGDWITRPDRMGTWIVTATPVGGLRLLDGERHTVVWQDTTVGFGLPMFSPDGKAVSMSYRETRDRDAILVYDAATGTKRQAARFPQQFHISFRADWVDNGRAFVVNRVEATSHIVLFDRFWVEGVDASKR